MVAIEICQGDVVITDGGGKDGAVLRGVIIDPEPYPGFATVANIVEEDPPQLGLPGTVLHEHITVKMPGRMSIRRIILGLEKSGFASPSLNAELSEGRRRGKIKVR